MGGLAVFVNRNLSLDISLGYASATAKFTNSRKVDINSTASGMGGNIGFFNFLLINIESIEQLTFILCGT